MFNSVWFFYDKDSESHVFLDSPEPEHKNQFLAPYDDLTEETSLGLPVLENTYVHVEEGACIWIEDNDEEELEISGGYELKKEAHSLEVN